LNLPFKTDTVEEIGYTELGVYQPLVSVLTLCVGQKSKNLLKSLFFWWWGDAPPPKNKEGFWFLSCTEVLTIQAVELIVCPVMALLLQPLYKYHFSTNTEFV
jgi:hypothetical protein